MGQSLQQSKNGAMYNMTFDPSSPVFIGEDLLTVFALVDGLVAVLALLLEVFSQRVEDGTRAGA